MNTIPYMTRRVVSETVGSVGLNIEKAPNSSITFMSKKWLLFGDQQREQFPNFLLVRLFIPINRYSAKVLRQNNCFLNRYFEELVLPIRPVM